MSTVLLVLLALSAPGSGPSIRADAGVDAGGDPCVGRRAESAPRPIRCRFECICFRTNGFRCLRTYTEPCDGRECWQCQDRVTRKARMSCSIGVPIRSCFCKSAKVPSRRSAGR